MSRGRPFGDITTGGPAQAPTPFMLTPGAGNTFDPVGGGASSLPGGGLPSGLKLAQPQAPTNNVNQSLNLTVNGNVGNAQGLGDMAKDLNIPRARQGLTGLPRG